MGGYEVQRGNAMLHVMYTKQIIGATVRIGDNLIHARNIFMVLAQNTSQLAFSSNQYRTVIGPIGFLSGR